MKYICKALMGSHAYGLNTPDSDQDHRGIFLHTDSSKIIGLNRHDHQMKQDDTEDSFYYELRHYLNNLRKSTTGAIELLFNENWIEITPQWREIQDNKFKLVDTKKFYSCLKGYLHGEKRLALGDGRTGKLGSKRKEALDRYCYSPKNAINALRLSFTGVWFLKTGNYPVNIRDADEGFAEFLMLIRQSPEQYSRTDIRGLIETYGEMLVSAFEGRDTSEDLKFDEDYANQLILKMYLPILNEKV